MKNKNGGLGADMGSMLARREKKQQSNESTDATPDVDANLIEEIHNKVKDQPRISFWDLDSKVALNYLKETKPKFSISKEISIALQAHLEKEYPEIWSEVKELMSE